MNETDSPMIFYTPEKFAALFGHTKYWTYGLLNSGKIHAITGYGSLRIPHSEVERIVGEATRYLGQRVTRERVKTVSKRRSRGKGNLRRGSK